MCAVHLNMFLHNISIDPKVYYYYYYKSLWWGLLNYCSCFKADPPLDEVCQNQNLGSHEVL